jgi:hypothetical protein
MAYQKLQASRALAVIPSDTVNIPNPAMLAISSTTTGASAGKLIDAAGDFVNKGVKIGDIVYSGTTVAATVTAVDSATQLSVSTAVATATAYKLYSDDAPSNGCVLYVGDISGGANVSLLTAGGDSVVLENLLAGVFIPIQTLRVNATSTNAAKIVALW